MLFPHIVDCVDLVVDWWQFPDCRLIALLFVVVVALLAPSTLLLRLRSRWW